MKSLSFSKKSSQFLRVTLTAIALLAGRVFETTRLDPYEIKTKFVLFNTNSLFLNFSGFIMSDPIVYGRRVKVC